MTDPMTPLWDSERRPSIADIKRAVVAHYGIRLADMTSERRARIVSWPRQVAMYLARDLTPLSLPQIGRHFGDRDHTTVMYAIRAVLARAAHDRDLARAIADLSAELTPAADPNQLPLPLAAE